ncbi:MAG: hypothetical protein JJE09_13410 [Bacteroidia bacterium]|nr:hypothetical protein [Bacteroidia bacterium]
MEPHDEKFSDDPQENLRMENELLKLKLQAQFGAKSVGENLPPDIENEFLKNVYAFEQNQGAFNSIKVTEFLGFPDFIKASDLDDKLFKEEYVRLIELLEEKSIAVDFIRPREDRFKYQFIIEELFDHTMSNSMPGMTLHFIYEEFHADHELDIRNRMEDFLRDWFRKEFNEFSSELSHQFILANGQTLTREEMLAKIQNLFDCYTSFINCQVAINEVKFQWSDETQTGIGHAEGGVRYDAVLETRETVHFEGPFKLYLSNEDGWWSIFYFVFPGFEW